MERFFIHAHGPDAEAERDAIVWLVAEARRINTRCAIVVPGLDAIRNLERAIGAAAAEFAKTRRYFTVGDTRVEVFSRRTKPYSYDGPVLVLWASDEMVSAAEEMRPPAICASPWIDDDLDEWKRAWNPIDVVTGEPVGDGPATVTSGLVEQALVSLTESVNLGTGITHPCDADHAKRLLKALHLCGEALNEMEIRTWAMSHGWQPADAKDLASLAGRIASGRAVRGVRMTRPEAKQIVGRLRELSHA